MLFKQLKQSRSKSIRKHPAFAQHPLLNSSNEGTSVLAEVSTNVPPPCSLSANNSFLSLGKPRVESSAVNLSAAHAAPAGGYLSNLANLSSISHAAGPSHSVAKIMPLRSKSQKRISAKAIKKIVSSLELSKDGATARRMNAESAARSNSALAEGKDFLL